MDYKNALKVHDIVEQIEKNNRDIHTLQDALYKGIVRAQITIDCEGGRFNSTIYDNDRIELLLTVLYTKNAELTKELEKF